MRGNYILVLQMSSHLCRVALSSGVEFDLMYCHPGAPVAVRFEGAPWEILPLRCDCFGSWNVAFAVANFLFGENRRGPRVIRLDVLNIATTTPTWGWSRC